MTGNTSSAVRQQRHSGAKSLDDFPTPPWATRALCEKLIKYDHPLHLQAVWEPACNRGHMARPLGEYFDLVYASDVADYGWDGQNATCDFLLGTPYLVDALEFDWIITNPPFRLAADFIRTGLARARVGVAVLVRVAFSEGVKRYETLFGPMPETCDFPFVERVVMQEGKLLDPDRSYWFPDANGGDGQLKKPSTATAYTWLVWVKGCEHQHTVKDRISPCRRRLTRPGDYPEMPTITWRDRLFEVAE